MDAQDNPVIDVSISYGFGEDNRYALDKIPKKIQLAMFKYDLFMDNKEEIAKSISRTHTHVKVVLTLTAGEYGDDQLANITAMMPLDRLPEPNDIADAVLYLARGQAVTGQILYVDGGANLKGFDRDFVHLGKG